MEGCDLQPSAAGVWCSRPRGRAGKCARPSHRCSLEGFGARYAQISSELATEIDELRFGRSCPSKPTAWVGPKARRGPIDGRWHLE